MDNTGANPASRPQLLSVSVSGADRNAQADASTAFGATLVSAVCCSGACELTLKAPRVHNS